MVSTGADGRLLILEPRASYRPVFELGALTEDASQPQPNGVRAFGPRSSSLAVVGRADVRVPSFGLGLSADRFS